MWDTTTKVFSDLPQPERDVYDACSPADDELLPIVLDTFRNSHKMVVRFKTQVASVGYPTFCSNGWVDPPWFFVSGTITESLDQEVTRTLNATFVSSHWTTLAQMLGELSPYKTLLRVERGVETPLGTFYVPMGVFRIYDVKIANERVASVTAYSQEADLRDARYITPPIPLEAEYTYDTLLKPWGYVLGDMYLVSPTIPPTIEWSGTVMNSNAGRYKTLPEKTTLTTSRDRLEVIKKMSKAIGGDFFFSRTNVPTIRDKPEFTDTVQLTVNAKPASDDTVDEPAVLTSFEKRYSRAGVYNAVVATSTDTASTTTYRGIAYDDDLVSPTKWAGPFGLKPRFYSSPFLKSDAECLAAAGKMLADVNRLKSSVDFSLVPNPFLEVGDVVLLRYPDGSEEKHIVRQLNIPLTASGTMTSQTAADSDTQAEISEM